GFTFPSQNLGIMPLAQVGMVLEARSPHWNGATTIQFVISIRPPPRQAKRSSATHRVPRRQSTSVSWSKYPLLYISDLARGKHAPRGSLGSLRRPHSRPRGGDSDPQGPPSCLRSASRRTRWLTKKICFLPLWRSYLSVRASLDR